MKIVRPGRLPDSVFELASSKPSPIWPLWAVTGAAILMLVAAGFSAQQSLSALDALAWEQRKIEARSAAQQPAASAEARLPAVATMRGRMAAVLADLERCHPPGARIRNLSQEVQGAFARAEIEVDGELAVHEWAQCLNRTGEPAGRWQLERVARAESGLGHVAFWSWKRTA